MVHCIYYGVTVYNLIFLSLKINLVLANREDPDEMPHVAAFHLGLHYLQKYSGYGAGLRDILFLTCSVFSPTHSSIYFFSLYHRCKTCKLPQYLMAAELPLFSVQVYYVLKLDCIDPENKIILLKKLKHLSMFLKVVFDGKL